MEKYKDDGVGGITSPMRLLGIVILSAITFASGYAATKALEVAVEIATLKGELKVIELRIANNTKELDKREPYIFNK